MTLVKRVLNPQRQRQIPEHFSWIDHRLVREHYIERADVQTILAGNSGTRANQTRARSPALLRGLIFTADGRAMTPHHTRATTSSHPESGRRHTDRPHQSRRWSCSPE